MSERAKREIESAVKSIYDQASERMLSDAIFGSATTANQVPEAKPPTADELVDNVLKFVRNMRREQIVFVVDVAHPGPMLKHQTPCDGVRVELSWEQAQDVHRICPLRLVRVNSPEQAEFAPVCGVFQDVVTEMLVPSPPFDMSDAGGAGQ